MKFKKSLIVLLIVTVVFSFSSLALGKTYTVGTSADFPPFESKEDGEFVGFDMDLIRAIAEVQGFDIKN